MFSAAVCTLHRGGSFLYGILTMEVGHHASEATLMTMFPLMGLRLSFGIVAETANIQMGEAEDFWAKLDNCPPQSKKPAAPAAAEVADMFANPAGKRAA